jgi:spore coat polysaccharide biosynthesis protein SpsF
MMLWLHGLPVVGWVFHRVRQAQQVDRIVFALPDTSQDDVLANYLENEGALVFRGGEQDVLGRYYAAAVTHGADTVVRVCADNPFVSGTEIDRIISFFKKGPYQYAYNHIPRNNRYPDGLGAEVATFDVLKILHQEATLSEHREHPFNYLWVNSNRFRIGTCDPVDDALAHPELKLDIDTISDYRRLLQLKVRPDSSANEIVSAALALSRRKL